MRTMHWQPLCFLFFLEHGAFAAAPKPTTTRQYTYSSVKKPLHCPTKIPTVNLTPITATASSAEAQFTTHLQDSGKVIPQYTIPYQNQSIVVQTHNVSQLVLFIPQGQSAIVDGSGVRLFTPDCSKELLLPVEDLSGTLNKQDPHHRSLLRDRGDVAVQRRLANYARQLSISVQYLDQCGTPLDGRTASATCDITNFALDIEEPPEEVALLGNGNGRYLGTCNYPNTKQIYDVCIKSAVEQLNSPTSGLLGSLTNLQSSLEFLSTLMGNAKVTAPLTGLATALSIPGIRTALGGVAAYQLVITSYGGAQVLAKRMCAPAKSIGIDVFAQLDTENDSHQLAHYTTEPFKPISATRVVSMPSVTCSNLIPDGSFETPGIWQTAFSSLQTVQPDAAGSSAYAQITFLPAPAPNKIPSWGFVQQTLPTPAATKQLYEFSFDYRLETGFAKEYYLINSLFVDVGYDVDMAIILPSTSMSTWERVLTTTTFKRPEAQQTVQAGIYVEDTQPTTLLVNIDNIILRPVAPRPT